MNDGWIYKRRDEVEDILKERLTAALPNLLPHEVQRLMDAIEQYVDVRIDIHKTRDHD